MILRSYQESALEAITEAVKRDRYILIQSPTGSGKTVLFSSLTQRWMRDFPSMRVIILTAQKELIEQAADKLLKIWPQAPIGVVCAGVSGRKNLTAPVVIASRQTLVNDLNRCPPFHFIIIDEVDQMPPRTIESQYRQILLCFERYFSDLRVLGVTASPFRLGHGYIYGPRCRPGTENWFQSLHYRISIKELQDQGYLVPFRALEVEKLDLSSVKKTGGDYNLEQLGDLMSKPVHITSAVQAYRDYGEERDAVVIFAVTIDHAEKLKAAFEAADCPCGIVHSKMPKEQREQTLKAFETGSLRFVVNVGVLTRGWDCPRVNCLIYCRPTESPALHLQITGRGLRPADGKEDLLVLDLSGNMRKHGVDLDKLKVKIPGSVKGEKEEDLSKVCPQCSTLVSLEVMQCPKCGNEWQEESKQEESTTVRDIHGKVIMRELLPANQNLIHDVEIWPEYFTSSKGNRMMKLKIMGYNGGPIPISLYHFCDVEGNASDYGRRKARTLWRQLGGDEPPPDTITEAIERWQDEIVIPTELKIVEDGKYLRVKDW